MTIPFDTEPGWDTTPGEGCPYCPTVRVLPDPTAPFTAGLIVWAALACGTVGAAVRVLRQHGKWGT